MALLLFSLPCLLFCLLLAPSAIAADDDDEHDPDYTRTGGYASLQAKVAFTSSDFSLLVGPAYPFPPAANFSWEPDIGMDVRLGWRQTPLWSIEAQFEWIPNHNGIEYGAWWIGANGKFYANLLEDRLQPYFLIGAGGLYVKQPQSNGLQVDWAFRNGIGVDYYLTENWSVGGETTFVWGVGNVWKYYYLAVGLGAQYRF